MKTSSIWGKPPKRIYELIKFSENHFKNEFSTCIVGCSDGKFIFPFARKGHQVVGYDIDNIALYGGLKQFPILNPVKKRNYSKNFVSPIYPIETKIIIGLSDKIVLEKLEKFAKVEEQDFYKSDISNKFDLVYTSCSLHYSVNSCFSLEEKTKKLQDIVKPNGLLYIDYMMAIDEKDYILYPKNKFYRKKEILNYFDSNWEVISIKENDVISFESAHVDCTRDHFHRFGYIFLKRGD